MRPKKLYKLVYLAYCWFLALANDDENDLNQFLFNSKLEAWVHGGIFPELYNKYKMFGWTDIPKCAEEYWGLSSFAYHILEKVWLNYGKYDCSALDMIIQQDKCWRDARKDVDDGDPCYALIEDKEIYHTYTKYMNEGGYWK